MAVRQEIRVILHVTMAFKNPARYDDLDTNEAGEGGSPASHYTCFGLEIELQRKLDISRGLRELNHTGSG
jgi:hypothetical protein